MESTLESIESTLTSDLTMPAPDWVSEPVIEPFENVTTPAFPESTTVITLTPETEPQLEPMTEPIESIKTPEPEATAEPAMDVPIPEPEPQPEPEPAVAQDEDAAIEAKLGQEINTLWSDHIRLSLDHKKSAKELRQIRLVLAERLHAMKSLLSRPGRNGQWRSWLRERGIARSTADRLVARHAETLGIQNENVPAGAIPASIHDGEGAKLAKQLWPDLKSILNTDVSVLDFIGGIAKLSGINHQWRTKGLLIFHAAPKPGDGLPDCTSPLSDLASKPSDEAAAITADTGDDPPAAQPPGAE